MNVCVGNWLCCLCFGVGFVVCYYLLIGVTTCNCCLRLVILSLSGCFSGVFVSVGVCVFVDYCTSCLFVLMGLVYCATLGLIWVGCLGLVVCVIVLLIVDLRFVLIAIDFGDSIVVCSRFICLVGLYSCIWPVYCFISLLVFDLLFVLFVFCVCLAWVKCAVLCGFVCFG